MPRASVWILFSAIPACGDATTPPAKDAGATATQIGDACVATTACPAGGSGTPVCLTDWPAGYCAVALCTVHAHDCPEDPGLGNTSSSGSQCVLAPEPTCLALCGSTADCRPGFICAPRADAAGHGTAQVCVPANPIGVDGGGTDGSGMDGGGMDGGGMGGGGMGGGMMDGGFAMMDGSGP